MSEPRCYTVPQVLTLLQLPLSTFMTLRRTGALPFLEELRPRIGRHARYRADLIDTYLSGEWGRSPSAVVGRTRSETLKAQGFGPRRRA